MLNRRLIRIRAMQALFAYKKAEGANFQLALDLIADHFSPDLNSMEFQDKVKLEKQKKEGQALLKDYFSRQKTLDINQIDEKIVQTTNTAKDLFLLKNQKDFLHYSERMVIEAEQVYDLYLQILSLFLEIADKADNDPSVNNSNKFTENQFIKALKQERTFEIQCNRRSVNISHEQVFITKLYREAIRNNERFKAYMMQANPGKEEEFGIIKYILKNIILKHEIAREFFEKQDLYWYDDIETLRANVSHTFQSLLDEGRVIIAQLDEAWSEKKEFLITLYKKTIQETKELEEILIPRLKNWDIERIAETDYILLKMAMVEMLNYPSIPVKVTINEIIEIAKDYSTPQSGQFINGILDGISKTLKDSGKIRKSGRGMLDNK